MNNSYEQKTIFFLQRTLLLKYQGKYPLLIRVFHKFIFNKRSSLQCANELWIRFVEFFFNTDEVRQYFWQYKRVPNIINNLNENSLFFSMPLSLCLFLSVPLYACLPFSLCVLQINFFTLNSFKIFDTTKEKQFDQKLSVSHSVSVSAFLSLRFVNLFLYIKFYKLLQVPTLQINSFKNFNSTK